MSPPVFQGLRNTLECQICRRTVSQSEAQLYCNWRAVFSVCCKNCFSLISPNVHPSPPLPYWQLPIPTPPDYTLRTRSFPPQSMVPGANLVQAAVPAARKTSAAATPKHVQPAQSDSAPGSKRYSLRSHNSKAASCRGNKPQHKNLRCHYCRSQDKTKSYIVCSNYPECRCGFCYECLRDFFETSRSSLSKKWVCPVCCRSCQCQRCKRGLITSLKPTSHASAKSNIAPSNSNSLPCNGKGDKKKDNGERKGREIVKGGVKRFLRPSEELKTSKKSKKGNEISETSLNTIFQFNDEVRNRLTRVNSMSHCPPMVFNSKPTASYFFVDPRAQLHPPFPKPDYNTVPQVSASRQLAGESRMGIVQGNQDEKFLAAVILRDLHKPNAQ